MNETPRPRGLGARIGVPAWIAADAIAIVALAYAGLDRLLLGCAGAVPLGAALGGALRALGAACVLTVVANRLAARGVTVANRERPYEGPAAIAVLGLLAALAGEGVIATPAALEPLAWTWHGLAGELDASMHASTEVAKAALVAWLSLVWALALGGPRATAWTRIVLSAGAAAAVALSFGSPRLDEARWLAALAALLPLVALALAESGRAHAAARCALAAAALVFVAAHETGLIALALPSKGVTRLDSTALVPLTSRARDDISLPIAALGVSDDCRFAAAALDDPEGLVRIDLASGTVAGLGLGAPVSALAIDAASGVGVGWSPARRELLSFRLEPLTVRRSALLPGDPTGAIGALAVRAGRAVLAHRAAAGLDEYALDTMSFLTERELGTGAGERGDVPYVATHVAVDGASGATFVALANALDRGDRRLLRLAPGRRGARLDAPAIGGDALALVTTAGAATEVLVGNARTGQVERFDAATLAILGTIEVGCDVRALTWEPRRGVAIALCRLARRIAVVDTRLRRVLEQGQLDAVPRALAIDSARDRLLIGDERGLSAVGLAAWLYPAPPPPP